MDIWLNDVGGSGLFRAEVIRQRFVLCEEQIGFGGAGGLIAG